MYNQNSGPKRWF